MTAMTRFPIRVEQLSKRFRLGYRHIQSNTLRDLVAGSVRAGAGAMRSVLGRPTEPRNGREWMWALQDVSFEVPRGQVVGFVGANGAGKSTLLKVLSRITEPTRGRAETRGRVGSLIEVGTGFHSELTGRENVFLNGAILGMRRTEIERKFDEIVAFAGVERFLDTPIKRYSSGMQLRLGFSVAAHLETEILIVDEVLAVGDAEFQRKCLATMGRVANDGRTVLFVSHNASAVESLCHRAIWLRDGRVAADGLPGEVLTAYLTASADSVPERVWAPDLPPGSAGPRLLRIAVRPEDGSPGDRISTSTPIRLELEYSVGSGGAPVVAGFAMFNEQEVLLVDALEPRAEGVSPLLDAGVRRATCELPAELFTRGLYRIEVTLLDERGSLVQEPENLFLTIVDGDQASTAGGRRRASLIRPPLRWESEPVGAVR
jgi:lipopolysaccharide transport system ATP-binding protein